MKLISNLATFRAIAVEAHEEMRRLDDQARSHKPDGSDGYVITLDPTCRSFKQALITVAFAGVYFEALTYLVARQQSESQARKVDRAAYREKLVVLKVTDELLLQAAESFRLDRNDLMHEKAAPVEELDWSQARKAQRCAGKALEFIESVERALAAR